MNEKGLGKRLQAARQAAGMTQQALCQKSGLSYSTLAKIERGAIKSPSIFTIESIAEALNTSLDQLIGKVSSERVAKKISKSKSGIRFVYFDVNGCLVRLNHHALTQIAHDSGKTIDVIETIFWHYNDKACRGEIRMEDFNNTVGKQLGLADFRWEDYYLKTLEMMPGMDKLVEWVSSRYGIGLLTNIMPGILSDLLRKQLIPIVNYDAVVDSSEVNAIKPEAKIFEIATKMANCDKSEILLIDDSRTNLMAGDRFGWKVLWFDGYRPDESIERIEEALKPMSEPSSFSAFDQSNSLPKIFETES